MKPTVGRIVLYTNLGDADGKYPPEQQAAIITKVRPNPVCDTENDPEKGDERSYYVSLHVFYPTGQFDLADAPFSAEFKRGHWTWPPRVP